MKARALVVALAVVAAACSDDHDAGSGQRPSEDLSEPVVDYSGVALEGVPGSTSTSILTSGRTTIRGSVSGPAGLVPGATVRIERLVGGQEQRTEVLSGPDGRFEVGGLPGGRYRVRAFLAPALALVTPDVRFLRAGEEHTFDLAMTDQRGVVARAAVAPDPPYLGENVNLAVVIASRSVDADGVVRSTPVGGIRVELDGLGAWTLRARDVPRGPLEPRVTSTTEPSLASSRVAFTDGSGQVLFQLTCQQPGAPGLSVLVAVTFTPPAVEGQPLPAPEQRLERLELTVPECVDPTATTAAPESDDEDGGDG